MNDCIFCKIVSGEIPSRKAFEDDELLAFYDISPLAPVHILLIPKKHIPSLGDISASDEQLAGRLLIAASRIAKECGLEEGYRVVSNIGEHGAQSVKHLHFHILGGRQLACDLG